MDTARLDYRLIGRIERDYATYYATLSHPARPPFVPDISVVYDYDPRHTAFFVQYGTETFISRYQSLCDS